MISKEVISNIEKEAKDIFKNLGPNHDWQHVERVLKTADYFVLNL